MKIAVFAVGAENGGALSNLHEKYHEACDNCNDQWVFIVSSPVIEERDNIKVISLPEIKRSWLHRLRFNLIGYKRIIKEELSKK